MARETIKRINGRLEKRPRGIDEFAKEVANALCDKYPDIDIFDLKYCFDNSFNYEISCRLGEESIGYRKEKESR